MDVPHLISLTNNAMKWYALKNINDCIRGVSDTKCHLTFLRWKLGLVGRSYWNHNDTLDWSQNLSAVRQENTMFTVSLT